MEQVFYSNVVFNSDELLLFHGLRRRRYATRIQFSFQITKMVARIQVLLYSIPISRF